MTKRIFRAICTVAAIVLLASTVLIMGILYDYFSASRMQQLRDETALAAQGAEISGESFFDGMSAEDFRVTWIAPDGTVKYDSSKDAKEMGNHLEREEVREALKNGVGESERYSDTLMEKQLYCAQKLSDGSVVRLSNSQYSVLTLFMSMLTPVLVVLAAAVCAAFWMASRLAKRIVRPLNEMDPDDPNENDCYKELEPLLRKLRSQQYRIAKQEQELSSKRREFEAASRNMTEGIVLLSDSAEVLSINEAAKRLLNLRTDATGKKITELCEGEEIRRLVSMAQNGIHAEAVLPPSYGSRQVNASPVMSEGKLSGIVLLIFDISEKEKAEQMRREFTANVSHELKTPLHTISGCAELLQNGMVKPQDIPMFAENIYNEAQRMIALVEDIIKLSRLDEGAVDMKREPVDLYALAQSTVASLSRAAQEAEVALDLEGESVVIDGIPQLLQGIIYNLCDNAIKYNKKGGSVLVSVRSADGKAKLTVKDTGIGIPPQQQERIFERFYRVDKSHSKEVGGTGLGLSIVKHAAALHNASIELHSTPGEGTEISVSF